MIVYRITRTEYANDLSGRGAEINGGRWNSPGLKVLYTSSSASLALLEALAWSSMNLLLSGGFVLAEISYPDRASGRKIESESLPASWYLPDAYGGTRMIGDQWLRQKESLCLIVPSAVLPIEQNILLNPTHDDFNLVSVSKISDLRLDERVLHHVLGSSS